jgi:hypothetical protein
MLFSPIVTLADTSSPHGQYCKTIKEATTNDTSACFKNANGTAGCSGVIREWAKEGMCQDASSHIFCRYTCTETIVGAYEEFDVVPESTLAGQIACLSSLGLTAAGVACILSTLGGNLAAAIASLGASETVSAGLTLAVISACGSVAGAAFLNWLMNPCCHTYCVKQGSGTPVGGVTTC